MTNVTYKAFNLEAHSFTESFAVMMRSKEGSKQIGMALEQQLKAAGCQGRVSSMEAAGEITNWEQCGY